MSIYELLNNCMINDCKLVQVNGIDKRKTKLIEIYANKDIINMVSGGLEDVELKFLIYVDVGEACIHDIKVAIKCDENTTHAQRFKIQEKIIELYRYIECVFSDDREAILNCNNKLILIPYIIISALNKGIPISEEYVSSMALLLGLDEETILNLNVGIRTFLFMLKQAGLNVFCDDVFYDGVEECTKLLQNAKKLKPYLADIKNIYINELGSLSSYEYFDESKVQPLVNFVVEQIYCLYLTNAGTVTDAEDFYQYFTAHKEENPAETFDILANAMIIVRAYFIENQEKINAYHKSVFKHMYTKEGGIL